MVTAGLATVQYRLLRDHVSLSLQRWRALNVLAIMVGLGVGFVLAEPHPHFGDSAAWPLYHLKLFSVAGLALGIAQWLSLRSQVEHVGWLPLAGLLAGACAGAFEGVYKREFSRAAE